MQDYLEAGQLFGKLLKNIAVYYQKSRTGFINTLWVGHGFSRAAQGRN
jgi:hypothetical protein